MVLAIAPTGAALGAEVSGLDLGRPLDAAQCKALREALDEHEVIFVRGQEVGDEDQIRFSAAFGELRRINVRQFLHREHPEILVVSNVQEEGRYIGSYDAGVFWHTDGAYLAAPHDVSCLRAIEVPVQDGRVLGDTWFASMTAAYDALPEAMKRRLEGLRALHTILRRADRAEKSGIASELMTDAVRQDPQAVHPVVRSHPATGRKCLFVTEGYTERIVGWPEDESAALLRELTRHCTRPEFLYRHHWQPHDILVWDDCATQHKATFDYALPLRRRMHRTTIGRQA